MCVAALGATSVMLSLSGSEFLEDSSCLDAQNVIDMTAGYTFSLLSYIDSGPTNSMLFTAFY